MGHKFLYPGLESRDAVHNSVTIPAGTCIIQDHIFFQLLCELRLKFTLGLLV